MTIEKLARENIQTLVAYPTFDKDVRPDDVWLNFNECPDAIAYGFEPQGINRYPEPYPMALAQAYARYAGVEADQVVVTRGGDEGIELVIRTFCEPRQDAIVICPPTYGMYQVSADTLGVECKKIVASAQQDWQIDLPAIEEALDRVKVIFICSPNNPTGQLIEPERIKAVLEMARGRAIVVVDEAYIEFCPTASVVSWLKDYPHLAIIRTLSKAFALAGLRCGFVLGNKAVIDLLKTTLPPYAVPTPVVDIALQALSDKGIETMLAGVERMKGNRAFLIEALRRLPEIRAVYDTQANFVLIKVDDALTVFEALKADRIFIRNQSTQVTLDGCLRISVGTRAECERVIERLQARLSGS